MNPGWEYSCSVLAYNSKGRSASSKSLTAIASFQRDACSKFDCGTNGMCTIKNDKAMCLCAPGFSTTDARAGQPQCDSGVSGNAYEWVVSNWGSCSQKCWYPMED